jgi:hypothetical protein
MNEDTYAKLYINHHVIKICFEEAGSSEDNNVISLRYTIDFPKVELHPYDTKLMTLYYDANQVNGSYEFNRKI